MPNPPSRIAPDPLAHERGGHDHERFPALDGLRGLAAVMVALSHYVLAFQPALLGGGAAVAHFDASVAIGQSAAIVLYNPELGVAIFFVLSGFVLAASVTRSAAPLPTLIVRRWVRLALPILGTSLLIWPLAEWHLFRSVEAAAVAKSDWLRGNYAWLAFETNDVGRLVWQSLVDIFARSRAFYNTALWTMPIEFRGSVALFAAYAALRRLGLSGHRLAPWLGLGAALAVLGLVRETMYVGFPCGVALFEARRLLVRSALRWHGLGGALLTLGVVAGGMPYAIDLAAGGPYAWLFLTAAPLIGNPVPLAHRIGAVCFVAAALPPGMVRRMLSTTGCRFLGRISFMLYLVHVPIICWLIAMLLLRLAPAWGYNAATAVLLPLFIAAALAAAGICTRAIDEPSQRVSRHCGVVMAACASWASRKWSSA